MSHFFVSPALSRGRPSGCVNFGNACVVDPVILYFVVRSKKVEKKHNGSKTTKKKECICNDVRVFLRKPLHFRPHWISAWGDISIA